MPRKAKPKLEEIFISDELARLTNLYSDLSKKIGSLVEFCGTTADYAAEADRKRQVIFDVVMNMQSQLVQMRKLMDWIVADKLK